jgi:hypothetical protein
MRDALMVAIVAAIVAAVLKWAVDLWTARRKDRLERIDRQLGNLYGPLYALVRTGDAAWKEFRARYRPGQSYWHSEPPPTPEEAEAWRLWMLEVFMPLNLRIEELIVGNADLLDEDDMPQCFLDLCAHVAAYKVIVQRWEKQDYSEPVGPIKFPGRALLGYVERRFRQLKKAQVRLLGSRAELRAPECAGRLSTERPGQLG